MAVYAQVEEVGDACRFEHGRAILASRDDGNLAAADPQCPDQRHRPREGLDTTFRQHPQHQFVLPTSHAPHRFTVRSVVGTSLTQVDIARREEVPDAVEARLAVDELLVVGQRVEGRDTEPPCRLGERAVRRTSLSRRRREQRQYR